MNTISFCLWGLVAQRWNKSPILLQYPAELFVELKVVNEKLIVLHFHSTEWKNSWLGPRRTQRNSKTAQRCPLQKGAPPVSRGPLPASSRASDSPQMLYSETTKLSIRLSVLPANPLVQKDLSVRCSERSFLFRPFLGVKNDHNSGFASPYGRLQHFNLNWNFA